MSYTGHLDTFARDHLPPQEQWPELIFEAPELCSPPRINCAEVLLDRHIAEGRGERVAILTRAGAWSYRQLFEQANRIAHVLVEDMGLAPGNRVLLPAPNGPMLAACLFAVLKAGGIAVPTMPLLRARELAQVVRKAHVTHALCDRRLTMEVEGARAGCPVLAQVAYFGDDDPDSLEQRASRKPPDFCNAPTAGDDVALIAFTSGTSGVPKGTMHFHRDLLAVCQCFAKHVVGQHADDIAAGTPPLAFTYGFSGLFLFPAHQGAATVLVEQYTPESLLETVQRLRVTVLYTAPTMYRAMSSLAARYALASLRACVSAGEALPVSTRSAWEDATGLRIIDGIGASEMTFIFIAAAGDALGPGATGKSVPGYRAGGRGRPAGGKGAPRLPQPRRRAAANLCEGRLEFDRRCLSDGC